jgi:hypothetical protein
MMEYEVALDMKVEEAQPEPGLLKVRVAFERVPIVSEWERV